MVGVPVFVRRVQSMPSGGLHVERSAVYYRLGSPKQARSPQSPLARDKRREVVRETRGTQALKRLVPVKFNYHGKRRKRDRLYGVHVVLPDTVPATALRAEGDSHFVSGDYVSVLLVSALQDMQARLEALERRVPLNAEDVLFHSSS